MLFAPFYCKIIAALHKLSKDDIKAELCIIVSYIMNIKTQDQGTYVIQSLTKVNPFDGPHMTNIALHEATKQNSLDLTQVFMNR